MIPMIFDYATPSAFVADRERALLGLSASLRRPVRFDAEVVADHRLMLRFALETLGKLVWSDDRWMKEDDFRALTLDPIVTVHDDRVMFEAFSQDQAAYGAVIVDRSAFVPRGEVKTGTTNVDFTAWLYTAISEMRTSRTTRLTVGAEGFAVETAGAGGRFERKVDVPEAWLRGFLELQASMAMPGTRLSVRPVDLLSAIRFLGVNKAKLSPRALRWVFQPGEDAALILEPWEHRVPLVGADHTYGEPRTIRTWGRRKLSAIAPLLPYADRVSIYLKGRALPSFFVVHIGAIRFVLALSSYTEAAWSQAALGLARATAKEPTVTALAERLIREVQVPERAIVAEHGPTEGIAAAAELVRRGRAIWDLEDRALRHRELFDTPPDLARIFPVDERVIDAKWMVEKGELTITSAVPRETRKTKRLKTPDGPVVREIVYRDWAFAAQHLGKPVEAVVSDEGRLIFAKCTCDFFQENLLQKGPCAHVVATLRLGEAARADLPTSVAGTAAPAAPKRDEDDAEAGDEQSDEDATDDEDAR